MKNQRNLYHAFIFTFLFISLSSFDIQPSLARDVSPSLKRTYGKNTAGKAITITEITLDKHTSREELIAVCSQLGKENVSLTFESVQIGRSFLGLAGKQRIRNLNGEIKLPNGSSTTFKAGGIFSFRYVKISYIQVDNTDEYTISMVEKVD